MVPGMVSSPDESPTESAGSGRSATLISPAQAGEDFARLLRTFCVQARRPSLEQLSTLSGVSMARLDKLRRDDPLERRLPNLAEALSIFAVLGPIAVTSILQSIGMVAELREPEEGHLPEALAGVARALGTLATAAADGRITRDEARAVEGALRDLTEHGEVFQAAVEKATGR